MRCSTFSLRSLAGLWLLLLATEFGMHGRAEETDEPVKSVRQWASLLHSKDLEEQRLAAFNLSKMGREAVGALKELRTVLKAKDDVLRFYALRALAAAGPAAQQAVPDLIAVLQEDHPLLSRHAAAALAQLGKEAVPPLSKLLQHPNPRLRRHAVVALGKMGAVAEAAHPALFHCLLQDESYLVRRRVAEALEQNPINTPAARAALLKTLRQETDPDVAASAAISLGKIGTEAVPDLLKLLEDSSEDCRYHAAIALRQLRSEAVPAVKPLTKLLTSREADVRQAATRALAAIGEPALPALLETLREPEASFREGALIGLTEMGSSAARAVKPIIAALQDKEIAVARQAALALGALGQAEAVEPLLQALQARDSLLRRYAITSLGQLGPTAKAAIPNLAEVLRGPQADLRDSAALALLRIGKESQPALRKLLADKEPRVRILALLVLGRLGGSEAVTDMAARLKDDNDEVRFFAARSLRELGTAARSAQEALQEALEAAKEPELQRELREALAAIRADPKE